MPHEREKPKQATECGGEWGRGWAQRKPGLVTQPAVLLEATCVAVKNKFLKQVYLLVEEEYSAV